jgi:hypothetical protein
MGSESTLEMREFSNEPDDSRFSARLARGRMRIITGETTERNPNGFQLTTRHATIGIRGTVLSVETNENFTGVGVDNTDKTALVNGTPVPQFHNAIVFGGGEPEITPRTPGEREGDGWLATGPGGEDDTLTVGGFGNGVSGGFGFADDASRAVDLTNMSYPIDDIPQIPRTGHASAAVNLTSDFGFNVLGDIGFDVDIESGRIYDGTANFSYAISSPPSAPASFAALSSVGGSGPPIAALSLGGGSGLADVNGNFSIDGFSGTLTLFNSANERIPTDGGDLSVWGSGLFSDEPFDLFFKYENDSGDLPTPTTPNSNYFNISNDDPADPIKGNLTVSE